MNIDKDQIKSRGNFQRRSLKVKYIQKQFYFIKFKFIKLISQSLESFSSYQQLFRSIILQQLNKKLKMRNSQSQHGSQNMRQISSEQKTLRFEEGTAQIFKQIQHVGDHHFHQKPPTKQRLTKDYQQSSQGGNTSNDKSWHQEEKQLNSKSFNYKNAQKKSKRRCSNTMASNTVRDLQKCMRDLFKFNTTLFKKIQKFQEDYKIKSQIWGVDAFLLLILHFKEVTKEVSQQKYITLLNLFISKLESKLDNAKDDETTQRIQNYILHVWDYKPASISLFQDFTKHIQPFFDKLVSKKKVQVKNSLKKIADITDKIKQIQSVQEKSEVKGIERDVFEDGNFQQALQIEQFRNFHQREQNQSKNQYYEQVEQFEEQMDFFN